MIQKSDSELEKRRAQILITIIMIAVAVWGIMLAFGSYLGGFGIYFGNGTTDIRKPLVVISCVIGFIEFWALLLWIRARKS